jgi:hypothetical protein
MQSEIYNLELFYEKIGDEWTFQRKIFTNLLSYGVIEAEYEINMMNRMGENYKNKCFKMNKEFEFEFSYKQYKNVTKNIKCLNIEKLKNKIKNKHLIVSEKYKNGKY